MLGAKEGAVDGAPTTVTDGARETTPMVVVVVVVEDVVVVVDVVEVVDVVVVVDVVDDWRAPQN